jgi:hypothetical protein
MAHRFDYDRHTEGIYKDAQHFADSAGPIRILPPSAFTEKVVPPPLAEQLQKVQPPLQPEKEPLPGFDIVRLPRIEVADLQFDYQQTRIEATIRNTGNTPYEGRMRWIWMTDCGAREGIRDITQNESILLESQSGLRFSFYPCVPPPSFCAFRASMNITPFDRNGRQYPDSILEKQFYKFQESQFMLTENHLLLRFLNGSQQVNCSHGYVINRNNAYDYDHATHNATFFIGFPLRNCGSQAGNFSHYGHIQWTVRHSPSGDVVYLPALSVLLTNPAAATPLVPGQGVLTEKALTLKVREGTYMLNVSNCTISISFADDLIH